MKQLVWLVTGMVAASPAAHADAKAPYVAALESGSAERIEAVLADKVELGPVLFVLDSCRKQFGTPATVPASDRPALAECLKAQYLEPMPGVDGAWQGQTMVIAIEVRAGKIARLGPFAPTADDAALVTFTRMDSGHPDFEVSAGVLAAIAKAHNKRASVAVKSCWRGTGAVASRIVKGSPVAGFDREAARYLAAHPVDTAIFTVGYDAPFDKCLVWALRYPDRS